MSKNKRERENEREKREREGVGRDNFTDSSDKRANVVGHIYLDQQNCAQLYYVIHTQQEVKPKFLCHLLHMPNSSIILLVP